MTLGLGRSLALAGIAIICFGALVFFLGWRTSLAQDRQLRLVRGECKPERLLDVRNPSLYLQRSRDVRGSGGGSRSADARGWAVSTGQYRAVLDEGPSSYVSAHYDILRYNGSPVATLKYVAVNARSVVASPDLPVFSCNEVLPDLYTDLIQHEFRRGN